MSKFTATTLRTALGITDALYKQVKPSIELADNVSVSIMEALAPLGIADKRTARPFVTFYIAEVREGAMAMLYEGERGITFGQGNKYERQVTRILSKMFDDVATSTPKPSANKADAVKQLVAKFNTLTKAEQRRFLASI